MSSRLPMRPIKFIKSYLPHAEGSCLVSMGKTQVLCVASVEEETAHAKERGIGWVHAEYAMLPRAGEKRSSRQRASTGGRSQEISRLVGRALRAAVDLTRLNGHTITIDCDVLRADGGTRTASVNGSMVALVQALDRLETTGVLKASPLRGLVGAVSVGLIKGKAVLDMDYECDKQADVDVNVVMTEAGQLVEVQGTAENTPFSPIQLNQMIRLAWRGIETIIHHQKKSLRLLPR